MLRMNPLEKWNSIRTTTLCISKTWPELPQQHLQPSVGLTHFLLKQSSTHCTASVHRMLRDGDSRSSLCSLVRVLELDCLALLHTQTSFKHLAQCSQLQEVSTFHDSKPLNCNLVQKMLLYVLKPNFQKHDSF